MSLTIASVNVNGIRAATKVRNEDNLGMLEWLQHTSADVVLMQDCLLYTSPSPRD